MDAYLTRLLRNKARIKDGDCTFCRPHRGENSVRSKNKRTYIQGRFIDNRKGKDKK